MLLKIFLDGSSCEQYSDHRLANSEPTRDIVPLYVNSCDAGQCCQQKALSDRDERNVEN